MKKITKNTILKQGDKIQYGWSNRWWDTNPDYYEITHWSPIKAPK